MSVYNVNPGYANGEHMEMVRNGSMYSPAPMDPDMPSELARWESLEEINLSLHQAARDGDFDVMKKILDSIQVKKKKKVNQHDENNLTPLHYAARYNHFDIVELLVQNKANPNDRGEDGATPLHYAARFKRARDQTQPIAKTPSKPDLEESGDTQGQHITTVIDQYLQRRGLMKADGTLIPVTDRARSVVFFLAQSGADINAQDIYGLTPLHFAAMRGNDVAAHELLNSDGIQMEAIDKQRMTPLHLACTHGNTEIAALLIEKGAGIRCQDEEGNTPLHAACMEGHLQIVKLLFSAGEENHCVEQMLTDRENNDYSTALHLAVDSGEKDIVEMCLQRGANVNAVRGGRNTALHAACENSKLDIIQLLLQKGARIDSRNNEQMTPLHRACQNNRFRVVDFLLQNGAQVERRDKDNFTPLLIAASCGHTLTIEVLLKYNANIGATDKHEKTAIFWAAEEQKPEALKLLLKHDDAEKLLDETDRYDNSPLHIACENGYLNCVRMLLDAGSDIDGKNEEEMTPLHLASQNGHVQTIKELVRRDESTVHDEDENSNTPLHLAAEAGHAKACQALIEAGADIQARNQSQWTPLDCAASKGWDKTALVLLDSDSPVDPTDKAKTTPLHLASKNGHVDMVKLLLEWQADVSLKDSNGLNCLDLAIDNNKKEVAEAIILHKHWRRAMCSCSIDPVRKIRNTPLRKLIRRMPDIAELVFNKCLTENDYPREHRDYCITFDYELLDDMFSTWEDESLDDSSSISSSSDENYPFQENGKLLPKAKPYTDNEEIIKINHPLYVMVASKRDTLLGHPLVTSLLTHKWASYGRIFYYTSLLFYLLFLGFFTGYIITTPPPFYIKAYNETNIVWYADGEALWLGSFSSLTRFIFGEIGHWIIIGLSGFNLLREFIQIYHKQWNYITFENLIEWAIYLCAIAMALPIGTVEYAPGAYVRYNWQWQLGAIGIFLAWINLILFIQKFPQLGIYVVMFTDILKTFLKFCVVFFLFIVAFAMAFYSLLMNQAPFHGVQYSLIKTFVMMIGEFEFDTIFHTQDYLYQKEADSDDNYFVSAVFYNGVTYTLFTIFLIIMSILIMNLLVGLAVDDIKEVQEQAKLQRLAMQVDLAFEVQEALPTFLWRRSIIKCESVYPNRGIKGVLGSIIYYVSGQEKVLTDAITTALNPEQTEIEQLQEKQNDVMKEVSNIKSRLKQMKAQNEQIENMLRALLKTNNISFEELDNTEAVAE